MLNGIAQVPAPVNEPIRSYAPGSAERASLQKRLEAMLAAPPIEIPLVIGGKDVRTGRLESIVCPHDHRHVLARFHQAGPREVAKAAVAAREAWKSWSEMPWEARSAVFLKAADLLAGPYRDTVNAATMLGQSKTVFQSEIDAACELVDFWRFNVHFCREMYAQQPISVRGLWDQLEYRPLEGFIFALTPFNFTAIGGNLPTAPAMLGNVSLWKPASTAVLSNHWVMKLLQEAGLPDGVVNFLPGRGAEVGDPILAHPEFAGIHFTGSTETFNGMWRTMAENLPRYKSYPRIVGETGGKDFVFVHPSAQAPAVVAALVRAAFEYQGQKCSACSRAYIPRSLWPAVKKGLREQLAEVRMGAPTDFRNFMAAVIDKKAFDKISGYIHHARRSNAAEFVWGGGTDASRGYFIEPTVVLTSNPKLKLMTEEIFGPVLTVYVYADRELDSTLELCDTSTAYALTGAVFAQDRAAIVHMTKRLRHAAGNFYINDKPTGAVVGQQPFGGGRASGTNDKAGSAANLMRWVSQRTIKENFVPPVEIAYPHMAADPDAPAAAPAARRPRGEKPERYPSRIRRL